MIIIIMVAYIIIVSNVHNFELFKQLLRTHIKLLKGIFARSSRRKPKMYYSKSILEARTVTNAPNVYAVIIDDDRRGRGLKKQPWDL